MKHILHVISSLNIGGTQVLLANMMSDPEFRKDRQHYFLVENENYGSLDSKIEKNGGVIIRGPSPSKGIFSYIKFFIYCLREHNISIVHSHVSTFSGLIVFISFLFGIKTRISHCHSLIAAEANISRRLYKYTMKCMANIFSTLKVACSLEAGKSLFFKNSSFIVISNGINFDFINESSLFNDGIECKLNSNKIKIGHIGRFVPEKNHKFLIDLLNNKNDSNVELHLIGGGEIEQEIRDYAKKNNVEGQVFFHGEKNMPYYILNQFDLMIFPSIREGFGIAVLEAQALGVPTIISDRVPKSTIIIPEIVQQISLDSSLDNWLLAIDNFCQDKVRPTLSERKKFFNSSGVNISNSVKIMVEKLYC